MIRKLYKRFPRKVKKRRKKKGLIVNMERLKFVDKMTPLIIGGLHLLGYLNLNFKNKIL